MDTGVRRERAMGGAEVLKLAVFRPVPVEVSGASGLYSYGYSTRGDRSYHNLPATGET